jgi:L-alanine-DL-glutamate epimerase-like enolase superfamily enzyme
MNVCIQKIEIVPIKIKLNEPFVISKGALTHAKSTVIIIHSDNGLFGTGECCPYRSIHGETQEGTIAVAKAIAPLLIGRNPLEVHALVEVMDRIITGNASIKCAFDMALHDLAAKCLDIPLYSYLGANINKVIETDMTISLLSAEEMVSKALKFVDQGFKILKVKLGKIPSATDVERMVSIRKAVGEKIILRIDANQGWNYLEAKYALEAMSELGVEHCEEPIPAWNRRDQIRLVRESPIPIMADEAIFHHHDAFQILADQAADMVNIKLGKSGGIANAMKIASIAEAADVHCQVGSFSETRVGITALVHFAHAWSNIIHYDLDSPLMLSEDPVLGGMKYSTDWKVTLEDTPGHGASFDPKFLQLFTTIAIQ